MIRNGLARPTAKTMTAVGAALALAACGGGGGGGGSSPRPLPTPTPTPAPAPAPAPAPTPTPVVNAAEYESSIAALQANALAAYNEGYTGAGIKLAVIDTGINPSLSAFTGRISPTSADVVASRGISDDDGHGTAVSAVAAANADGNDMLGVAFEASIVSLRADEVDSCTGEGEADCEFFDRHIAAGVDRAVLAGASVINMSLGGGGASSQLIASLQAAADAGIVLVVSAGNEGDTPEGVNPNQFALDIAQQVTGGVVIIAGSVGTASDPIMISDFSNRAGTGRNFYLTARGYRVQAPDNTGTQFLWSGTSFSAPAISGAVALLAQAFPNLTGAEIVDILFTSAADRGDLGIDSVYGHGELDIGAAIAPAGTTSVAGTKTAISLADNGELPAAAGDAARHAMSTIITDRYDRAYAFDVNSTLSRAAGRQPLHQSLTGSTLRHNNLDLGKVAFSVSIAPEGGSRVNFGPLFEQMGNVDREQARLITGSVIARIDPETRVAFGFSESASTLTDRLTGDHGTAFLVAKDGQNGTGFTASRDHSFGVRRDFGPVGVTVASEAGSRWTSLAENGRDARYRLDAVTLDRKLFGEGRVRLGLSLLDERETLLGGRLSPALGDDGKGSQTRFIDLSVNQPLGGGFALGLSARRGWTEFGGGAFRTGAYSIDVRRDRLLTADDRLAFRLSQPLRVESGGLDLYLPQAWDWRTESATMGWQQLSLVPSGRELVGEVAYGRGLLGGRLDLNAYYRHQPQHIATADGDVGAAIRFTLGL
ncbi:S8 family peptidase [Sphingomicrobium clamense]|uniref:S8 family serine peptidase n=1 Tax=Sphingomicrobium clamense TaxID=2851013 RepID=A0ABS6V3F9_9SPHN|nr:S8 family peptidase [Sphingomicrobium sp. B8]MBW0144090.1 S8 family serine peptidase [Sphingomicrobium sp. B8]